MTTTDIVIPYDPDRWVAVPLRYEGTAWADAGEWSSWFAAEATRGREGAKERERVLQSQARELAVFPAEHVSARFWHYPADGYPGGFVDVFVEARVGDAAEPADLLPELGFTMVEPVVERAESDALTAAVRRLSLSAILPSTDADPVLLPKAEWLATGAAWVVYAVSVDHDVSRLEARLSDCDALFRSIDPGRAA